MTIYNIWRIYMQELIKQLQELQERIQDLLVRL